jgi:sugar lactone lactonase YvrE
MSLFVDTTNENIYIVDTGNCVIRVFNPANNEVRIVAGTPQACGYAGDGKVASHLTLFMNPFTIRKNSKGDLFITDQYRLRKIDSLSGLIVTTVDLIWGDYDPATMAQVDHVSGLWGDTNGHLIYVDRDAGLIRKIIYSSSGEEIVVTTGGVNDEGGSNGGGNSVAYGSPVSVSSTSYEQYSNAFLCPTLFNATSLSQHLSSIWGDSSGTLYFFDDNDFKKVDTVTGNLHLLQRNAIDSDGNVFLFGDSIGHLYLSDPGYDIIYRYDLETMNSIEFAGVYNRNGYNGDGISSNIALLNHPSGVWVNSKGDLFIADSENFLLRKVNYETGIITTIAGNGDGGGYYEDDSEIRRLANQVSLNYPFNVIGDTLGNLYIADFDGRQIRCAYLLNGIYYMKTIIGSSRPGGSGRRLVDQSRLISGSNYQGYPQYLWLDSANNLFWSDDDYPRTIKRTFLAESPTSSPSFMPGQLDSSTFDQLPELTKSFLSADNLFLEVVAGSPPDQPGTPADLSSLLSGFVTSIWGDTVGNIYANTGSTIRKISENGKRVEEITNTKDLPNFNSPLSPSAPAESISESETEPENENMSNRRQRKRRLQSGGGFVLSFLTGLWGNTDGSLYFVDLFRGYLGVVNPSISNIPSVVTPIPDALPSMLWGTYNDSLFITCSLSGDIKAFNLSGKGNLTTIIDNLSSPLAIWGDSITGVLYYSSTQSNQIFSTQGLVIPSSADSEDYPSNNENNDGSEPDPSVNVQEESFGGTPSFRRLMRDIPRRNLLLLLPENIRASFTSGGNEENEDDSVSISDTELNVPGGIWVDSIHVLYVTDVGNGRVLTYNPLKEEDRQISVFIGPPSPDDFSGESADVLRNRPRLAPVQANREGKRETENIQVLTNGPPFTASLKSPYSVWGDSTGNIFVSETGNSRILKVNAEENSLFIYADFAINASSSALTLQYLNREIGSVWGDSNGNVFFMDLEHCVLRRVDDYGMNYIAGGHSTTSEPCTSYCTLRPNCDLPLNQTTFSSMTDGFWGDTNGQMFFIDESSLLRVNNEGIVNNIRPNAFPGEYYKKSLTGDSFGNIYISDTGNCRIVRVSASDNYETISVVVADSDGHCDFAGEESPAIDAWLSSPAGVWIDSLFNLYIADSGNSRVRKVNLASGIISTFAGTGRTRYNGDMKAATSLNLAYPYDVIGDSQTGNLFIADSDNYRIRMVFNDGTGQYLMKTILGNGEIGGNDGLISSLNFQPALSAIGWVEKLWLHSSGVLYFSEALMMEYPSDDNNGGEGDVSPQEVQNIAYNIIRKTKVVSSPTSNPTLVPSSRPHPSGAGPAPIPAPGTVSSFSPISLSYPTLAPSIEPSSHPTPCLSVLTSPTNYPSIGGAVENPSRLPTLSDPVVVAPPGAASPSIPPTSFPSIFTQDFPTSVPSISPRIDPTLQPPTGFPTIFTVSTTPVALPVPSYSPSTTTRPVSLVNNVSVLISHSTHSSNSSVVVLLLMSVEVSLVYGGVYSISSSQPISTAQIIGQHNVGHISGNSKEVEFRFTNLIASMHYSFYFVTKSSYNVEMNNQQMIATRINATTDCCRMVSLEFSSSLYLEQQSYLNFFSVKPSSLPSTSLILSFKLLKTNTTSLSVTDYTSALIPSALTLTSLSSTSTIVALSGIPFGTYQLIIVLSGKEANYYRISSTSSASSVITSNISYTMISMNIASVDTPLPAPILTSAVFNGDGSYLIVSFDSATNFGGFTLSSSFPCSALFEFPSSCSSLSSMKCSWVDTKTVIATSVSCLNPADNLKLISSAKIRAQCPLLSQGKSCSTYSTWPITNSFSSLTKIGLPVAPVSPTIVISIPQQIGECSPLLLDLTSSSGDGGRGWRNISVIVSSPTATNRTLLTQLQHLLDTRYVMNPPSLIDGFYFQPNTQYSFLVKLCNFLGKCSSSSSSLNVLSSAVPVVSIVGSSSVTIKRSQTLSVMTSISLKSCSGSISSSDLSYSWSVVVFSSSSSLSAVVPFTAASTSKDPTRYLLSSYTLAAGSVYEVSIKVSYLNVAFSTAAVQIIVKKGNLIATIKGNTQQAVRVKELISLDASKSYDEDYGNTAAGIVASRLLVSWSCYQLQPTLVNNCESIFTLPSSSSTISNSSATVLSLTALASAANTVAQLTVIVMDNEKARSAYAIVTVTVLPEMVPVISLTSGAVLGGANMMNSGQSLQLTATVQMPAGVAGNATWEVLTEGNGEASSSSSLNISTSALTPISQKFLLSTSASFYTVYLALRPNTLSPGQSYTFALKCLSSTMPSSVASVTASLISVIVNSPPIPGQFSVSPLSGKEIFDSFAFTCSGWIDNDLPVSYRFSYISHTGNRMLLRSLSIIPYTSSPLPAGSSTNDYKVFGIADIYDSYNANTTSAFSVTVKRTSSDGNGGSNGGFSSNATASYIADSLDPAKWTSVDDIIKGTAMASYLLNSGANCSHSPNCTSLNRHPCYFTSHTCGSCVSSSFISSGRVIGDSNEICFDPASFSFSASSSSSPAVNVPAKLCPADCSEHGNCVVMSSDGDQLLVEKKSCLQNDFSCKVSCRCDEEYSLSQNCELSNDEMKEKMTLRRQVIDGVITYIHLQDVDDGSGEETISSWIASINDVSQNSHEIASNSSIASLLDVTGYALSTALRNGYSGSAISSILTGIDSVSSAVITVSNPLSNGSSAIVAAASSNILGLLSNYSSLVSGQLLPGQAPVTAVEETFRFHVETYSFSSTTGCNSNLSASLPRSTLERLIGQQQASVLFPACPSSADGLRVSLISTSISLYTTAASLLSNPVTVSLSSSPCSSSNPADCFTTMVFPNLNHQKKGDYLISPSNITLVCSGEAKQLVSCPGDEKWYNVSCLGKKDGDEISAHCPGTYYQPSCDQLLIGSSSIVRDIGCVLLDFNDKNISCSCPLYPSATVTRRRLTSTGNQHQENDVSIFLASNSTNTAAESVEINYVSLMKSVTENFETTLLSSDSLSATKVGKSWAVLVTLCLLISGIIASMVLSYYADQQIKKKISLEQQMFLEAANIQLRTSVSDKRVIGRPASGKQTQRLRQSGIVGKKNESLMSLAEEALPQILRSRSLSSRIWNEIKRYHRWFGVIYYYSSTFSRVLRVLSLSSNIVIMLFMQSLTYSLTQGDDGSCSEFNNELSCLSPPSAYGGGKKCYWTPSTGSSSSDGDCAFVQPDKSIEVMIFVAIFSALLSTPIALLIDWLIHNILAAPTWDLRKKRMVAPISPSLIVDDVKSKATSSSLYGQSHHNPNKLSIFPSTPSASSAASSSVPAAASLMKRKTRSTTISLFGSRKSKANPNWTKLKYYKVVTAEFEKLKSDLLAYRHTLVKKEHRKELNGKLFLRELFLLLTYFVFNPLFLLAFVFFLCLL